MFTVSKDYLFSAAHAIRGHQGGCQNLHGHNYRVRVYVAAATLDGLGMVIDFADLKRAMAEVLDRYDHRVLNEIPPFDVTNTTAELLSEHVWTELQLRMPAGRRVARVEVWETETSCAIYEPDVDGPAPGAALAAAAALPAAGGSGPDEGDLASRDPRSPATLP